jgi:mxaA protein
MRRWGWITLIALLPIDAACAEPAGILFVESAPTHDAVYQTGDLIHQHVQVGVESAYTLEAGLLPSAGAVVADGLEVRQAIWTRTHERAGAIYRVEVIYQLFKTVGNSEQMTVPALGLGFVAGDRRAWLEVPAWSFTQQALAGSANDAAIKEALPPLEYNLQPTRRLLAELAAVLLLTMSYAWLRRCLFKKLPPFAAAAKTCKRLSRREDDGTERSMLLALHRAVDRSAGYALFRSGLPRFLAEHPEFTGMEAEFRRFFYVSERFFYANSAQMSDQDGLRDRLYALEQFCANCAAREI